MPQVRDSKLYNSIVAEMAGRAASQGEVVSVDPATAEHMGVFVEDALDIRDGLASRYDIVSGPVDSEQQRQGPGEAWRQELAERVASLVQAGTAPWQRKWLSGEMGEAPYNPATGQAYGVLNRLTLGLAGFKDPRWMTIDQANRLGGRVRDGERSTIIEYWQLSERRPVLGAAGEPIRNDHGRTVYEDVPLDRPQLFYARVFNAEQVEGLEPYRQRNRPWDQLEESRRIIAEAGVHVSHDQVDRAFYSHRDNTIHLPREEFFRNEQELLSTTIREVGHATSRGDRLDRVTGPFGSEADAVEELRITLSTYIVGQDLDLGTAPGRAEHMGEQWAALLRESPDLLFKAIDEADELVTWLYGDQEIKADLQEARQLTREAEIEANRGLQRPKRWLAVERWAFQKAETIAATELERNALKSPTPESVELLRKDLRERERLWVASEERAGTPIELKEQIEEQFERDREFIAYFRTGVHLREESEQGLNAPPMWLKPAERELWEQAHNAVFMEDKFLLEHGRDYSNGAELLRADAEEVREREYHYSFETGDVTGRDALAAAERLERAAAILGQLGELQKERQAVKVIGIERGPDGKVWLDVPFDHRHAAKAAGAQWDPNRKSWFAAGELREEVLSWAKAGAPERAFQVDPREEFSATLRSLGFEAKREPVMDGSWQVLFAADKDSRSVAGSYRALSDSAPLAEIRIDRTGELIRWAAGGPNVAMRSKGNASKHDRQAEKAFELTRTGILGKVVQRAREGLGL